MFSISIIFLFNLNILILNIKEFKIIRKDEILILIILFFFFLISILPLTDTDSIAVHLRSATYIFLNGLENLNFAFYHEFLSIANSEIILLISPILNSDNFGS